MDSSSIGKKIRTITGILTAILMCAGYMPVSADALADHKEHSDPFAFRGGAVLDELREEAEEFPPYFDLRNVDTDNDGERDKSFVTKVKTQNPYGTCWGFAAISAADK